MTATEPVNALGSSSKESEEVIIDDLLTRLHGEERFIITGPNSREDLSILHKVFDRLQ